MIQKLVAIQLKLFFHIALHICTIVYSNIPFYRDIVLQNNFISNNNQFNGFNKLSGCLPNYILSLKQILADKILDLDWFYEHH